MTTVIETHQLTFSYGAKPILKGLDLTVHSGEIIGLIGVNGAGKTTFLSLLLGLLNGNGQVRLFDHAPTTANSKSRIGSMLQGDIILAGVTVWDLVQLAAAQTPHALDTQALLADLGLSSLKAHRLNQLSGGQLRRVTFAIALVGNPDLLFLDEPTVGMDARARQMFWDKIAQLRQQGKTIVITSHYLEELQQIADRLLILQNGHFVFDGTIQALQSQYLGTTITGETDLPVKSFVHLSAVDAVHLETNQFTLHSTDGDQTLRALVPLLPHLHQVSVTRESLEDIFLQLTGKDGAQ